MTSTAMFISNIRLPEILIILLIVLLLFGAKKLPDLARNMGRSLRIMRAETRELQDDDGESERDGERSEESRTRRLESRDADTQRAESAHRPTEEEQQLKRDA